ncbi:hypothetical protein [Brevundimonas sp.]|uniref:hypothetical protein n=1 Tax=Brevundimonas sp. TaxID=1871086 RepID=UPI003D0F8B93
MKNLVRIVLATAAALAAATSAAALLPTAAVASESPFATIIYVKNYQAVGSADLYCNGDTIYSGDTENYDYTTTNYHHGCP